MPDAAEQFSRRLVAGYPQLRPLLEEHLKENFGELLPHLLMSDVELFVEERVAEPASIRPLLDWLENEFGHDAEVDNVIAVSFVEVLPYPTQPGHEVIGLLGPKLRAELATQRPDGH